jgi:hypothetical protein
MKLSGKQIDKLSFTLLERLKKNDAVSFLEKESEVLSGIKNVITEDAAGEARLDREVKKLMEAYADQMDRGEVDSRKVFGMIKAKLAKEKGIVL